MSADVLDPVIEKLPTSPKPWPKDGDNRTVGKSLDLRLLEPSLSLGINAKQRLETRRVVLRAAGVGLQHAASSHYTEGPLRWSGIVDQERSIDGHYPLYADCSAFAAWCFWDASRWLKLGDFVNGLAWRGGFTGTMCAHGERVDEGSLLSADCVFYGGSVGDPEHVAVHVGNGRVISDGSESGPLLLPVDYRSDITEYRRFVL